MVTVSEGATVIQAVSSTVLAFFTVVLAVATWRYYKQTKEQTSEITAQTAEMTNTRKLNYEPKLKAGVRNFLNPNFCLSFVNIGGGLAQDVTAEYYLEYHEDEGRNWGKQVVFPEEVYNLGFPIPSGPEHGVSGPEDQIENKLNESGGGDTLVVEFDYKDSAGNTHEDIQRFSILENLSDQTESTEFFTGSQEENTDIPTF